MYQKRMDPKRVGERNRSGSVTALFADKDGNSRCTPVGAERVTHVDATVKIEGAMGLDSADFYPKSEVFVSPGHKSRGVKSITTYRTP